MADYTIRQDGTGNKAASIDGDPSLIAECMDIPTAVGETYSPGDNLLFTDEGGVFRDGVEFVVPSSGTDGSPITLKNYLGDTPILGPALVTTWEDDGSDIWYATLAYDPKMVFIDDNWGVEQSAKVDCDAEYKWYWDSNVLYIYSESDPDTNYTSPGIEVPHNDSFYAHIDTDGQDWLVIDGLTLTKSRYDGLWAQATSSNVTVKNCTASWNRVHGLDGGNDTSSFEGWVFEDNLCEYNGGYGITINRNHSGTRIRRNTCRYNGYYGTGHNENEWTAGIKVFGTGLYIDDCIVEQNVCHGNGLVSGVQNANRGIGIWMDHCNAGSALTPNIVRHNLVYDNKSLGIYLEKNQYSWCYSNILYNNDAGENAGYQLGAAITEDGELCQYNKIYNNIVCKSPTGAIRIDNYRSGTGQILNYNEVKNNIVKGYVSEAFRLRNGGDNDGTNGTGNVYENNWVIEATDFVWWGGSKYATIAAWEDASSGAASDNVGTEPSFTDYDNDDYTLVSDSPCINQGVDLGPPFNEALMPETQTDDWPDNVVTGDQDDY